MPRPYPEEFTDNQRLAAIALSRFGLGARPGDFHKVEPNPYEWLLAQLDPQSTGVREFANLPSSSRILAELLQAKSKGGATLRRYRQQAAQAMETEAAIHEQVAVHSHMPFRERLVGFWRDHFALSTQDPDVLPLVYAFEREVIRPNLNRRFFDMLLSAARHPAMLIQTGNTRSSGPLSERGQRSNSRLDARMAEVFLNRLAFGPGGDFGEKDISALARIFSGWTIRSIDGKSAGFHFDAERHQPGKKYFLGRNYPDAGVLEGEAALDTISRTPAVGAYIARELARHFIMDEPIPDLVDDLVDGYANSGGSLQGLHHALIQAPTAWRPQPLKLKTPADLVHSAYRGSNAPTRGGAAILSDLKILGQPPAGTEPPTGWSNRAAAWLSPETLMNRLDWGAALAQRIANDTGLHSPDAAVDLALDILGPQLRPQTYRRIAVTRTYAEGLALLFASPEFQRR